ncbi:MAG: hypothetical protein GXO07_01965 [Crenarchaeota archaeon]|nr:hypothetical protein [Thermoproteota archaeon]
MREEYLFSLMALAMVAGMATAAAIAMIMNKRKEKEEKFVTVVRCPKCGYEVKREWKEGDFVGLVQGPCPKCGAMMIVWNIYKEGGEEPPKGGL